MVDFSQSSGMRPLLICMQPRTLPAWLSGYKASSAELQMRMDASLCCTIAITWLQPLVTPNGSPNPLDKFSPKVSHPVQE